MDTYDASDDRGEVAAGLGGREGLPRLERADRAEELRPRDAPVPLGDAAHGAHARLHDRRRRHPLPRTQRDARPAPAGLRLVRPAGRERRDPRGRPPAREHRAQHRAHHALVSARRLGVRLGPPALDPRSRVLPLAAVAVPALPRARARVPEGRAGEVVPERPDRARERAGARRPLRAVRRRGRVAPHGAVVLPDHRLRAGAARRPRHGRLAGVDQGAPAQLDRPLGGRRDPLPHRGAGTRTSRSSRRARTRSTARPSSSSRPSTSSSRASTPTRCASTCGAPRRRRPPSVLRRPRRPASSPACTRSTR